VLFILKGDKIHFRVEITSILQMFLFFVHYTMLEAKNTVDTTPETEKVSSKKELSPAEKAEKNRKMKEMMKNVELTKQNGQLKKLDDEKAADNLLREMDDAPNKEGNQNVIYRLL
jgi:hypothetical protein